MFRGNDISQYSQNALDDLKKSEEKFRNYIENSPTGVLVVNKDGLFLEANKAICKITGYSIREILKLHIPETIAPESQDAAKDHFERVVSKGRASGELGFQRKDGSKGYWQVDAVKISENRYIAFISETTARRESEEKLRETSHWLEESQRVAKVGTYVFNVDTGLWTSSEVLNEIFGIPDDYHRDVKGWLEIVHPEHREEMRSYLELYVLSERNPFDKEYRIVRLNDGEERWVHGLGKLIFDEKDNPVKMLGTIQDNTRYVKTLERLLEKIEELEKWQRLTIGRENKMVQLKNEIKELKEKIRKY